MEREVVQPEVKKRFMRAMAVLFIGIVATLVSVPLDRPVLTVAFAACTLVGMVIVNRASKTRT